MFKFTNCIPPLLLLVASRATAQDALPPAPAEAPPPSTEPAGTPPAGTPPPAEPAELAPPPPAPAPPALEPEGPGLLDRLGVGKRTAYWQPNGLLQSWLFFSHESETTASEFRLRRAEIRVRGEMVPGLVSYLLMIDAARSIVAAEDDIPLAMLQDFAITLQTPLADLTVGQFKIPISLEALTSNPRLMFPERPLVTRAFSDTRDMGFKLEKKFGDIFYYYAGVFNGAGQNLRENDREKDVALRLEVYPLAGLTVAAAGYARVGDRDRPVKDRVEGDLRYDAGGLLLQAEYIRAWDGPVDARVEGHGAYGIAGYLIGDHIQPALRVGYLDTDIDADGQVMHYEGCVNYLLSSYEVKFALSVGHFMPDEGPSETQVTFLSQVWF